MKQKGVKVALGQQVFKKFILIFLIFFNFLNITLATEKNNIKILNEIEFYLNNIKYLKANFIQDDIINSQLSEGEFYLSKPEKLRIDYQNPFEASLFTDAKTTIYYDKELNETNSVKTANTPLHFLLKKNISFKNNNFSIIHIENENENEFISISFKEKRKEDQGILILKFKKNPIILSSIKIINNLDQEIEMKLFNISTNPINNSIFIFKK